LRAGKLRHRVDIQVESLTPDGLGGFSSSWGSVTGMSSVPAAIMPLSSKEQLDAMKLESVITNKIRIRYRAGITSKHRIVFGSRIFNIKGAPINYDERNKSLDFLVTEDI
jgi:SPP1 family predicted phage head-tail adaptor